MKQDSFNELKLGHFFSKLFSVGRVGECNMGAIVSEDSSLGDSWMPAVAGNVADDITFGVFDDAVSEYNETIGQIFEYLLNDFSRNFYQ